MDMNCVIELMTEIILKKPLEQSGLIMSFPVTSGKAQGKPISEVIFSSSMMPMTTSSNSSGWARILSCSDGKKGGRETAPLHENGSASPIQWSGCSIGPGRRSLCGCPLSTCFTAQPPPSDRGAFPARESVEERLGFGGGGFFRRDSLGRDGSDDRAGRYRVARLGELLVEEQIGDSGAFAGPVAERDKSLGALFADVRLLRRRSR